MTGKAVLEARLHQRIQREGPVSFADFMEMALYDLDAGYYITIATGQDYFTSPMAHPIFAALLAIQMEQVWQMLGQPSPFTMVEIGAGRGLLGRDILEYGRNLSPEFSQAIHYLPVEMHQGRLPDSPIEGVFLSNEFLDALPTHLVVQQEGRLREIFVSLQDGRLVELLGEPTLDVVQQLVEDGIALPEGYRTEVNLEVPRWMAQIARSLGRGVVLTIDYGYLAHELYAPQRQRGTLLCYYQHTYNEEPLKRVGCQDITSHVDFTAAIQAGEKEGLSCLGLLTQREFLTHLGIQAFLRKLASLGLPPAEYQANLYAMQELIRPEGIGGFKVLVQARGLEGVQLWGVQGGLDIAQRFSPLKVPRLRPEHLPLYQARYPWAGTI